MASPHRGQIFVVSVICGDGASNLPRHCRTEEEQLVSHLIDRLKHFRLVATWALPGSFDHVDSRILVSPHEAALLASDSWTRPMVGRTSLARELSRKLGQAQTAGVKMSTLVIPSTISFNNLDLLVKRGFTAISTYSDVPASRCHGGLTQLRWGMWSIPPAWVIPMESFGWLPTYGHGFAQRLINRLLKSTGIAHFSIDLLRLAKCGTAGRHAVERLFRMAARQRDEGTLENKTIAELTRALYPKRNTPTSESILRRAA